jgi:hypothetical protein
MTLKEVALALHTFEKTIQDLQESRIKTILLGHTQEIHALLVSERLKDNEVRNFQLSEPDKPEVKQGKSTKARK